MKELTIEQKARRYDEAIKRAKSKIKKDKDHVLYEDDIIDIFSELKESEDEKIRKKLLSSFKGIMADADEDELWYGLSYNDIIAWFEKQGEQKKELLQELDDKLNNSLENETPESLGKFLDEQNPVDNVKQKFKVGDWVVRGKTIAQIIDIQEQYYVGLDIDGNDFTSSKFLSDDKIHLWTIQDAKDGDVLAYENDIVIFKENTCNPKDKSGCMFVYCSCNNFYEIGGINPTDYKPATKEQRYLLFQKMHEAGYEWDAEHKQLKKIEQKHAAWSEEDKKMARFVGNAITADDASTYLKDKGIQVIDAHIWLDELKDRIQPQNLTVNDEELNQAKKEAHNDALNKIEYHSGEPTFDDGWSAAIWYLKKRNILQSKTIWKPSDEQMKALSYCIKYHIDNDGVYGRQVVKLYQDLLKLK